jgi:hypothetical protein
VITALCVRKDSVYKKLGCDCYDAQRDMNTWPGGNAIIAHPPCGQWGRFAQFATVNESEKELALTCISLVRQWGGILEHPAASKIFGYPSSEIILPLPGLRDKWGGYTICVNQHWWGHRCEKKTLLYICGCEEKELPPIPINFDAIQCVISPCKTKAGNFPNGKKTLSKAQRDKTPIDLARWMIEVAGLCNQKKMIYEKETRSDKQPSNIGKQRDVH